MRHWALALTCRGTDAETRHHIDQPSDKQKWPQKHIELKVEQFDASGIKESFASQSTPSVQDHHSNTKTTGTQKHGRASRPLSQKCQSPQVSTSLGVTCA